MDNVPLYDIGDEGTKKIYIHWNKESISKKKLCLLRNVTMLKNKVTMTNDVNNMRKMYKKKEISHHWIYYKT